MAGNKPGPDPKGRRSQITLRLPEAQAALYKTAAHQQGLSLGDYLTLQLALAHELDVPAYLRRVPGEKLPMAM